MLLRSDSYLANDVELERTLFIRYKEELSLSEDDLQELEAAREKAWTETRKKYSL